MAVGVVDLEGEGVRIVDLGKVELVPAVAGRIALLGEDAVLVSRASGIKGIGRCGSGGAPSCTSSFTKAPDVVWVAVSTLARLSELGHRLRPSTVCASTC